MGFIFEVTIVEFVVGVILFVWLIFTYMTSKYSYWKNRSIAYEEPSFPFGTDKQLLSMKQQVGKFYQSIYAKFKKEKVVGMFALGNPYLLIRDPELLKQVLTKDFHHFVDRGLIDPDVLSPVLKHMFHLKGEAWKTIRNKLVPAFTSGKMKMMFYLIEECSNELIKALEPIAEKNGKIAVKDFTSCFTTDVIASCAFGLKSNSVQNPDDEFRANGKKIFESSPTLQMCKLRIASTFPWLINKLHIIKPFGFSSSDFFVNIIADTIAYREKNGVVRNDFLDLLIKIKNNKSVVDEEKSGHTVEMKDGEDCKPETLRRYSSLSIFNRQCVEDYKLPDMDIIIPKGMKIVIPVYAIHHDLAYYPDPYKFDPERFTDDKINTKNNYTFMPFGEGPRMCIGNRFAMMQMKSCLSLLIHNYELAVTDDTPIPVTISRKQFLTIAESPVVLKISKPKD